ncbi:MAG: protein kinase [Verrucomicrobiae bacterium]|nr:protein kinase [Verrucomicrobiae bacterium]MCP5539362.1 protein kinase [Akkermansiaceae bacterium]MCP5549747.1 protein kinase [Akkermansiaceae bacterium]
MADTDFDGYQKCEPIGSGCSGEVFKCSDAGGLPKAIKRLNSLAIDRQWLDAMCRRAARMPEHPGVVAVTDYQFERAPYFIVSEWVNKAGTLEDVKTPQPETEAWMGIFSLAEACAHLHRNGVAHGNLHPGNIFLTPGEDSAMRIADFGPGMAGRFHHIDIGETAWFAPPEQLENPGGCADGAAERWDVYRFGVVAYWLIEGRLPRGQGYAAERRETIANSGGRPVPVNMGALAADLRGNPAYEWRQKTEARSFRMCREIVDQCLSIDPEGRPVDMRAVRNAFRALETRFALEDAEERVEFERQKQAGKLLRARLTALGLAAGLMVFIGLFAAFFLRSHSFKNRVTELGMVIDNQKHQIEDYSRKWAQSLHELKNTRAATDSLFAQVNQADNTSDVLPEGKSFERENLEKSRDYFIANLEDLGDGPETKLDRARGLHNLAHIDRRLGDNEAARKHFGDGVRLFEEIVVERAEEVTVAQDSEARLADSYETLVRLSGDKPGEGDLNALRRASVYLEKLVERRPEDRQLGVRQATNHYRLALELHGNRQYEAAIDAFSKAVKGFGAVAEADGGSLADMGETLCQIQCDMAASLRGAGHLREAFEANLAAMETLANLAADRPYTPGEQLRLGRIYTEVGDLLGKGEAPNTELEDIFTESMRLLMPLAERQPEDIGIAIPLTRAMSRIALIEAGDNRWTDGYRLSVAAVERLEATLNAADPKDYDGRLSLVELRGSHINLLQYQRGAASHVLEKGLTMAEAVREELNADETLASGRKQAIHERLGEIYEDYAELCKSLGETKKAQLCDDRARDSRQLVARASSEESGNASAGSF